MWAGMIPVGNNPIALVRVKGASKRKRKRHNLSVEEFHKMLSHLDEPFRTMMQIQLCLGLRVSELLALRWKDVDWMGATVNVERGMVMQHLDSVKTEGSSKIIEIDAELLRVLQAWKQLTEFAGLEDWIFASPVQLGRLPISYTAYKTALQAAAATIGICRIGTHDLRQRGHKVPLDHICPRRGKSRCRQVEHVVRQHCRRLYVASCRGRTKLSNAACNAAL
jgi:integrase